MRRDLPIPGSPTISISWPSPCRARSLPSPHQHGDFLVAADERREMKTFLPSMRKLARCGDRFVRAKLRRGVMRGEALAI
jgi:hypothetical protein